MENNNVNFSTNSIQTSNPAKTSNPNQVNVVVVLLVVIVIFIIILGIYYLKFGPGTQRNKQCFKSGDCPATTYCAATGYCLIGFGKAAGQSCREPQDCQYGSVCISNVCKK